MPPPLPEELEDKPELTMKVEKTLLLELLKKPMDISLAMKILNVKEDVDAKEVAQTSLLDLIQTLIAIEEPLEDLHHPVAIDLREATEEDQVEKLYKEAKLKLLDVIEVREILLLIMMMRK